MHSAPDYVVTRDASGALVWRRPPVGQRLTAEQVEAETIGRRQVTIKLVRRRHG